MSARRRSLLLAAAFLGLAVLLTTTRPASAQPGKKPAPTPPPTAGAHQINQGWALTPEQFRSALGVKGDELPPEVLAALRQALKQQFPNMDEQTREQWAKFMAQSQEFRQRLKDEEERWKAGKKPGEPTPDFGKMLKNFPQMPKGADPKGGPPPIGMPNPPPAVTPSPRLGGGDLPLGGGDPKATPLEPPKLPPPPPKSPNGKAVTPPVFPPASLPALPRPAHPKEDDPRPVDKAGPNQPAPSVFEFPPPPKSPEQIANDKAVEVLGATWERNVGPLDETPQVKDALRELVEGTSDFKGPDGENFWDALMKDSGSGGSVADWFDGLSAEGGGNWKWPSFDWPSFGLGRTNAPDVGGSGSSSSGSWWSRRGSSSSSGSSGSGFGFEIPGLEGTWWPLVILAAILLGALAVWRFWYLRDDRAVPVHELGGLGPWPVDPRRIATREQLVLAFEYLSVLICGPSAKTWTHNTIAAALADLAATHAETAIMLARLYELARYAPLNEPLTAAEIAEARRLVCHLAGVSYE